MYNSAMQGSDESMTAVDFVQVCNGKCYLPRYMTHHDETAYDDMLEGKRPHFDPACPLHGAQQPTVTTTVSVHTDPPITQEDARRYKAALEEIAVFRPTGGLRIKSVDDIKAIVAHALHPEAEL